MSKYTVTITGIFCSLILMSQSFAERGLAPEDDGDNLFVNFQNLGTENCYLIEKTITQGKLTYSSIPSTLYATGENNEFIMQATYNKSKRGYISELSLKYACGENKTFSLSMKNHQKKNYKHRSTDIQFEGINVYEKHQVTPGWRHCTTATEVPMCGGKASKITWMITQ